MNRTARKFDPARYRRLLSRTMPVVIETDEEHARMSAIVDKLTKTDADLSVEEEELLKLLARLIEDFEQRYDPPSEATPLELLHHLMEVRGVKPRQLWNVFGSKGITSEVLNGKRGISKSHVRALANYFHVPADLFV